MIKEEDALRRFLSVWLAAALILSGALAESWIVDEDEENVFPDRRTQARVLMRSMSLEEKVWQLLVVEPETLTGDTVTSALGTANVFERRPVGGVVIFGQNIASEAQLKQLTADLNAHAQKANVYAPFIAVSEEGGAWSRVANKLGYEMPPSPLKAAEDESGKTAYETGKRIGEYLTPFGVNLDLAPVSDVLTASRAWVRDRVYGTDAGKVAAQALQMADGLRAGGVIPCFSHFPGQGNVVGNLNNREVGNSRTLAEMRAADWVPFRRAAEGGAEMIMVSHAVSKAAGDKRPASLSSTVVAGWLRGELGYDGVVITDSLRMGAIRTEYKTGEAAVLALQAGCDLLLLPADADAAAAAVLDAIDSGELTVARIEESVERVLALKIDKGIIK